MSRLHVGHPLPGTELQRLCHAPKMVRLPGIEPGPSRWQRDIITTRLKAHISEGRYLISDGFVSPQGLRAPKKLLVGESNPGRLRDRQKCYQLHQRGLLAWVSSTAVDCFGLPYERQKVLPGFEPGSLDSKSRVLTNYTIRPLIQQNRVQPDSNRRPRDLQSLALPLSYAPITNYPKSRPH